MKKITAIFIACLSVLTTLCGEALPLADPFILLEGDTYYAYGTSSDDGIAVFTSKDLKTWQSAGLALHKQDVWGEKFFWAPEVYKVDDGFLMYYSAEEHICCAKADSPLGPFKQTQEKTMFPSGCSIDHTLFIDSDGTPYIYFTRFIQGNSIWTAQLEKDLVTIKADTLKMCFAASQKWELVQARVNEGSAVLKHDGKYFLTYSGNDYQSRFYGIGYATADSPSGPWVKNETNPIYQCTGDLVGVGHHAFFHDKEGVLRVVFHAHNGRDRIHPRLMHISSASFRDGKLYISPDYFTPQLVKTDSR